MATSNIPEHIIIVEQQYLIQKALFVITKELYPAAAIECMHEAIDIVPHIRSERTLLIIDWHAHTNTGTPIAKDIVKAHTHNPIIIITTGFTPTEVAEISTFGLKNILLKSATHSEIIHTLQSALQGTYSYPQEILSLIMNPPKATANSQKEACTNLTPTEIDIARLIAEGMTTKDVANHKNVSVHTITTHRKNIFRKLHISSVSELVMYAVSHGIIDPIEYYI